MYRWRNMRNTPDSAMMERLIASAYAQLIPQICAKSMQNSTHIRITSKWETKTETTGKQHRCGVWVSSRECHFATLNVCNANYIILCYISPRYKHHICLAGYVSAISEYAYQLLSKPWQFYCAQTVWDDDSENRIRTVYYNYRHRTFLLVA